MFLGEHKTCERLSIFFVPLLTFAETLSQILICHILNYYCGRNVFRRFFGKRNWNSRYFSFCLLRFLPFLKYFFVLKLSNHLTFALIQRKECSLANINIWLRCDVFFRRVLRRKILEIELFLAILKILSILNLIYWHVRHKISQFLHGLSKEDPILDLLSSVCGQKLFRLLRSFATIHSSWEKLRIFLFKHQKISSCKGVSGGKFPSTWVWSSTS